MKSADGHAGIEQLVSLELGELAADEARALREHLKDCGICEAERALAAEFAHDAGAPLNDIQAERMRQRVAAEVGAEPVARGRSSRSSWLQRSLIAAAFVFAAIGVYQFRPQEMVTPPGQVLRSGRPDDRLQLAARTTSGGWYLEWEAEEGATACSVVVRSMRGEILWSRAIAPGPVEISADELSESGASAPWFVAVRCTIGDREFESSLVTLGAD